MNKINAFCLILFLSINQLIAQDARLLSKQATDAMKFESMEMSSTLKIYNNKGAVRTRQLNTATKKFGETNKTLLEFTAPADVKGTTLLIYDNEDASDDMWIYMPALRKVRRIVSSEKGKNFMGSEFTNADLSVPNLDDFNYKLLGEVKIDEKPCWKIESTCKNENIQDEYGISKRISYLTKENSLAYKIEYFDLDGELSRVQQIKDYRKQANGQYFAFYMEMENIQNGRKSVMNINQFQLGSKLIEDVFSPITLNQ